MWDPGCGLAILPEWYHGTNPHDNGNTYTRGHAIMGGFDENDTDFHFKEYALVEDTTPDPQSPSTTPSTPDQNQSEEEETKAETCNLPAPENLDFELRIIGVTKTYLDLEWDKIDDKCFGGYKVYYGTETGKYTKVINTDKKNKVRIKNLNPTRTYYFVVKAYDIYGKQTGPSNEVGGKLLLESFWKWLWIFIPLLLLLILSITMYFVSNKKEKNKQEPQQTQTNQVNSGK